MFLLRLFDLHLSLYLNQSHCRKISSLRLQPNDTVSTDARHQLLELGLQLSPLTQQICRRQGRRRRRSRRQSCSSGLRRVRWSAWFLVLRHLVERRERAGQVLRPILRRRHFESQWRRGRDVRFVHAVGACGYLGLLRLVLLLLLSLAALAKAGGVVRARVVHVI